jgi:serine/threonine-protein kinase
MLFDELASGGYARVHLGRLHGDAGFARLVAIKRLHEGMAGDPDAERLFLDEARLAARVRHPNVVQTLDVLADGGEFFLVMDYVHGETLARLLAAGRRRGAGAPPSVVGAVLCDALAGLHAAHETVDEFGRPLGIVHRDVSPQNVMVGADGVARVLDFGIAKANDIGQRTREGDFRGKLSYAAPEQLEGKRPHRAVDVYASGVVLWEALAGRRLFDGATQPELVMKIMVGRVEPPSAFNPAVPRAADELVLRALSRDPAARFPTAAAMAYEVERALGVASARDVGAWVRAEASEALARYARLVARVDRAAVPPSSSPYGRSDGPRSSPHSGALAGAPRSSPSGRLAAAPRSGPLTGPASRTVDGAAVPSKTLTVAGGALAAGASGSRARRAVALGAPLLLVAVGLGVARRAQLPHGAVAASSEAVAPVSPSLAAPPPLDASGAPAAAPVGSPAAAEAVASEHAAHAPAGAHRPAPPAVRPRVIAPVRPPRREANPPAGDCKTPYTIDAEGRRRYKPECF